MSVFLSLEDAAERLGVDYKTAYHLIRRGDLPAGKIGRVYRVREDDLNAFFERQKEQVTDRAQREKAARSGFVCAACGHRYLSELSVGGHSIDSGDPICQPCWSIHRVRNADGRRARSEESGDTPQPVDASVGSRGRPRPSTGSASLVSGDSQADRGGATALQSPAMRAVESPDRANTIEALRREGKPVVSTEQATSAESCFLRSFGQRLESIDLLADPLSGRSIPMRSARVRHAVLEGTKSAAGVPANRISRFRLRVGGWGKPRATVVIEARYLSRPSAFISQGFDCEPLTAMELGPALEELRESAAREQAFTWAVLASSTGWSEDAAQMIEQPRGQRGFADRRVAVVLVDLLTERVVQNHEDARLASIRPLVDPQVFAEQVERVCESVRSLLAALPSLSLEEASRQLKQDTVALRAAFHRLASGADFVLDQLDDLGMVLSPRR